MNYDRLYEVRSNPNQLVLIKSNNLIIIYNVHARVFRHFAQTFASRAFLPRHTMYPVDQACST